MGQVIEDFRQLSKEEKLKEGIIVIYNRTITSLLLCEFIYKILTEYVSLEKNELYIMIRDIVFNDLFNGIGKLFSKTGRNDTCSIDGLNLGDDRNLENEYEYLQEIYSKEYKEIRDRITGHLDMSTLVKMETKMVKFEEIENFLILIKAFLEKAIPNHKDIFQVELFNIEDKRKQYDIQLKSWLYEILLLYGIEEK